MSTPLDKRVFAQTYNYTDCLAMDTTQVSLHHALTIMTTGAAYASGIISSNLWAIITPTMDGYRVELFKEEE